MPEFRQNVITGNRVVIAEDRAARPGAFAKWPTPDESGMCPFCEGNESETPPEVLAVRSTDSQPNGPGWQVRIVPNRYPALSQMPEVTGASLDSATSRRGNDWTPCQDAIGRHEVIIESPTHIQSFTELAPEAMSQVVRCYRDRLRQLAECDNIACAVLFKNSGAGAGASLSHIHSQLMALPFVPQSIEQELERCDLSTWSDWLEHEQSAGERIVCSDDNYVVLCPFASRFPLETWIVPTVDDAHFETMSNERVDALATLLQGTLSRLEATTAGAAYNFYLRTAPWRTDIPAGYRWRVEIVPRLVNPGGFEWATGIHLNPISPERATQALRDGLPIAQG